MNYLIFCSFEVGGFPYKMADVLNRHNINTYYISLAQNNIHDEYNSTEFHYGKKREDWDLSSLFEREHRGFQKNVKLLKDIKSRYDIGGCFATGSKAYLLEQAGMNYRYWSYGADLDQYYKFSVFSEGFPVWKKGILYPYYLLTYFREQRKSIVKAHSLLISSHQLGACQKLCPDKQFFFLPHLINVMEYEELCRKKIENKKRICEEINAEDFFFSSTRHFWSGKNRFFTDYKGNDIILYSFAHYLRIYGDKKSKLILVGRGPDAGKSKKLIQQLGINDVVVWINEMRRDELWPYYQGASICFGQFGIPVLNYVAIEPLSNATPCISFVGNNNTNVPFYNTMPPILNSKYIEEIAEFMRRIISDREYASNLSYNSWFWAKENCSEEKFVDSFLNEMRR